MVCYVSRTSQLGYFLGISCVYLSIVWATLGYFNKKSSIESRSLETCPVYGNRRPTVLIMSAFEIYGDIIRLRVSVFKINIIINSLSAFCLRCSLRQKVLEQFLS